MHKVFSFLIIISISGISSYANPFLTTERKGKLYLYWGYNRESYSKSTIHFKSDNYDFKLKNVVAHDRPSEINYDNYLTPKSFSIPQYQYRIGYYFKDNYSLSFGFNHMKYVMDSPQKAIIDGTISAPEAGKYIGTYNNEAIEINPDFLTFEHTNGLNFLAFELERIETFWKSKNEKQSFNAVGGTALGIIYPKSDINLFQKNLDKWHLAGYGVAVHVGIRFDFLQYLFLQTQLQGGFINMPDILTTDQSNARASQSFFYLEEMVEFGGYISLFKKHN